MWHYLFRRIQRALGTLGHHPKLRPHQDDRRGPLVECQRINSLWLQFLGGNFDEIGVPGMVRSTTVAEAEHKTH